MDFKQVGFTTLGRQMILSLFWLVLGAAIGSGIVFYFNSLEEEKLEIEKTEIMAMDDDQLIDLFATGLRGKYESTADEAASKLIDGIF